MVGISRGRGIPSPCTVDKMLHGPAIQSRKAGVEGRQGDMLQSNLAVRQMVKPRQPASHSMQNLRKRCHGEGCRRCNGLGETRQRTRREGQREEELWSRWSKARRWKD